MAGIVRTPRRPEGWVAPGPRPRGAMGDPSLAPADDEDLCLLTGEWRIFQKLRGHRWSMDDLVTAWIAQASVDPGAVRRTLDLGCGIGSVLLMTAWRFAEAQCVGIEAQDVSFAMAARSVRYNGVDDRVRVLHGDFRGPVGLDPNPGFDLVTGTPPYFPPGTGVESGKVQCGPCRFEHRGGIEDYCDAAARCLAETGTFVVCGAAGEHPRALAGCDRAGLKLRAFWRVVPKTGAAPLVGVWVIDRRHRGPHAEHTLTVRDPHQQWTPDFLAVRADMGLPPPLRRPG